MIIVSSSDPDHNITSNQQSPVRKWLLRTLSPQNGVIWGSVAANEQNEEPPIDQVRILGGGAHYWSMGTPHFAHMLPRSPQ